MTKTSIANLKKKMREEGAPAAYEALLRVLNDKTASPTALASAGNTILKASGLLDKTGDGEDLEPHEMTLAQLQKRRAELQSINDGEDEEGVFD